MMTEPSRGPEFMPGTEEELLDWLKREGIGLGTELIGDDAAILESRESFAVTMDTQIEGVHFLAGLPPEIIAERLVRVNLSDLAAMGGSPSYAFLSLSGPPDLDRKRFLKAILDCCRRFEFRLAGGDLSGHAQTIGVLTLLGERTGSRWLERSAARAGHGIWIGGALGEAAIGLELMRRGWCEQGAWSLGASDVRKAPGWNPAWDVLARSCVSRYIRPVPQLTLGCWLAGQVAGAAMDISDGLAKDLNRLCRASAVGAEVDLAFLPVSSEYKALAEYLGLDWIRAVIQHGDDYVLLFTLPSDVKPPAEFDCFRIGQVTDSLPIEWNSKGRPLNVAAIGWDHLRLEG